MKSGRIIDTNQPPEETYENKDTDVDCRSDGPNGFAWVPDGDPLCDDRNTGDGDHRAGAGGAGAGRDGAGNTDAAGNADGAGVVASLIAYLKGGG